jgi:hypothetical protein
LKTGDVTPFDCPGHEKTEKRSLFCFENEPPSFSGLEETVFNNIMANRIYFQRTTGYRQVPPRLR